MIESGVDEFKMSTEKDLRAAMPVLARLGVPLLVHAELDLGGTGEFGDCKNYGSYLASRPRAWEVEAVRLMIRLARETRCRTHIVHLSAAEAIADLRAARAQGVPVTAETCPHYLHFTSEGISAGSTHFKCAPPIRESENRERLWHGLRDGDIEFVVSDHSPCTPQLKLRESGDFERAWGGIAGLQFSLPVTWTEMQKRGHGLRELTEWMSVRTARFAGLEQQKGRIAEGLDADLVLWEPERKFQVERTMVRHRHDVTPYEGAALQGVVNRVWVRGNPVYEEGQLSAPPSGRQVKGRL